MARLSPEKVYDDLHDQHSAAVARAFREAMDALAVDADRRRVIQALEAGDVEGAIEALHIEGAAYGPLLDALDEAYAAGGEGVSLILPAGVLAAAVVLRFNRRAPAAIAWRADYSAALTDHLVTEQKAAVRTAILAGQARGARPSAIATDILGRRSPNQGKRRGGALGVTSLQAQAAVSALAELTSDDPADKRRYLERKRRNKRYDPIVKKALAEGKPVPARVADQAAADYRTRLLELRSTLIGRKEALAALQAGKHEALRQVVIVARLPDTAVRRRWRSVRDTNVRHTHQVMTGQTVGLNEPFRSPSGARLMFPGDPRAPSSETTGCRCDVLFVIETAALQQAA